ncbi:aldo/keto reductase [uncultured Dialister sp.]|mgnify:CR=1 FL=1|uniref:aldo/keto reductase n=1 Tax=uncultured Dialister sp. TaxID=278064 RepID=UPI0025E94CC2|nr:aldo/keto reductase [uncultured Dialister sp.]
MEYVNLGHTDIRVSRLCVGCMSFGKAGTMHDWTLDEEKSAEVIHHALDLGINFFDTANGYSAGTSEEYLGKALKGYIPRDRVVRSISIPAAFLKKLSIGKSTVP